MIRNIIMQGNGTLTITLPKKWTDEVGLKGSDQVEIVPNIRSLLVKPLNAKTGKSIKVDIDNFDRMSLAKFLIACYELGVDIMDLSFSKPTIKGWNHKDTSVDEAVQFFVSRLVGYEILSHGKNHIRIGNIVKEHIKFDSIISRIFFLIEEYLNLLISAMKTNDLEDLKNRESRHDNITKLVCLATRETYEADDLTAAQCANYNIVLSTLDKTVDFIRYAYHHMSLSKTKAQKDTIALAQMTLEYIELYRAFFCKFNYSAINEMDSLRGRIKTDFAKSCNSTNHAALIAQFDGLISTLHGAIKPRIAIEIEKDNS